MGRRKVWPTFHYYRLACGIDVGVGSNVHRIEENCPMCKRKLPVVEEPERWMGRKCGSRKVEEASA